MQPDDPSGKTVGLAHHGDVLSPISADSPAATVSTPQANNVQLPVVPTPVPTPTDASIGDKPTEEPVNTGIYPAYTKPDTSSTANGKFLTGSQIVEKEPPMPVGIYILAGFYGIGIVSSFLNNSRNSTLLSIAMVINLLLCIGLLMRQAVARKIIIWVSALTIFIAVINIFTFIALQQTLQKRKEDYRAAIAKIELSRATTQQQLAITKIDAELKKSEKEAGKSISVAFAINGLVLVESGIVIFYLTRLRVKQAFEDN